MGSPVVRLSTFGARVRLFLFSEFYRFCIVLQFEFVNIFFFIYKIPSLLLWVSSIPLRPVSFPFFLPSHHAVKMRKNHKECTSKECLKPSGLWNLTRCACCSYWYHINCINITLSDSKLIQQFHRFVCVNVKSVKNASIADNLELDSYVNTAISNVRVLKRLLKYSRLSLAESLLDKMEDVFLQIRQYKLLDVFSYVFQKKWSQTNDSNVLQNKQKLIATIVSLFKPLRQGSNPLSHISRSREENKANQQQARWGKYKGGIRLAA